MSNFVIVGGGITGCVCAFYLLNKKKNVTIIEKGKELGGILKDIEIDSKKFFRGCQYIAENSKWIELLNYNTKKELYKFQNNYGSLTESNQIIFEKNYPGPVFKKKKFIIKKNNKLNNLSDVYNFFSSEIKNDLIKIFQKFNLNFKKFHFKSRYTFKFFRILFLDNEKKIKNLKKEKNLDEILGLKNYNKKNLNSLLPKNGYDKFFNKCYKYLSKKSKVMLSTAAIPSWKNGQLEIKTKDKIFKNCKIIWTANPTILVKRICNEKLDTIKIQYDQYSTNIKKKIYNFYVNCFLKNSNITRIYTYRIKNTHKLNVECINNNKKLSETEILKILNKINVNINRKHIGKIVSKSFVNYDALTLKSNLQLKKLYNLTKDSNLICSRWDLYSRNTKINKLINELKK